MTKENKFMRSLLLLSKIALMGLILLGNYSYALCSMPKNAELVTVKRIIDGDTIVLNDDTRVRLIGINAPELAKKGKKNSKNEPFALEAKNYLQNLIAQSNNLIYLAIGEDKTDKYGRLLAHTFNQQKNNLEEKMLQTGLAFRISYAPNTKLDECLKQAENKARYSKSKLWHSKNVVIPANKIHKSGFNIIKTTVINIKKNRGGLWLETDDNLVLNISPKVIKNLNKQTLKQINKLIGKNIEARGWIIKRKNKQHNNVRWLLPITSDSMIKAN